MTSETDLYHLHVHFDDTTVEEALAVRKLAMKRPEVMEIGRFHERPVGPHPVRQFQILLKTCDVPAFSQWLDTVRGPLDVLIHPEIEDDLLAHTDLATWLGDAHELKVEIFS